MAEGRSREQWRHTSAVLAMTANANPFRKGDPLKPSDFDPYEIKSQAKDEIVRVPLSMILDMFAAKKA